MEFVWQNFCYNLLLTTVRFFFFFAMWVLSTFGPIQEYRWLGQGCLSLHVSSWAVLSLETEHRVFRPPILVLRHEDFIAALHVLAFLAGAWRFLTHKLLFLYWYPAGADISLQDHFSYLHVCFCGLGSKASCFWIIRFLFIKGLVWTGHQTYCYPWGWRTGPSWVQSIWPKDLFSDLLQ